MKFVIAAAMIFGLVGCARHTGQITGKVVDVSYGGLFFDSCEIIIQKGEGSSTMDQSSSRDKVFCDRAESLAGKTVLVKYLSGGFNVATETNDIISSLEEVK